MAEFGYGWDQIKQVIVNIENNELEMGYATLYLKLEFMIQVTLLLKEK